MANGIESATCVDVALTYKLWKELKLEIKEIKENIKIESERYKLVFEDLRKANEGDWRERFADGDWVQVVTELAERSDRIEAEVRGVRSFITKEERPDVGGALADAAPEGALVEPERLPADPDVIVPPVETDREDGAKKAARARRTGGTRKARGAK